MIATSQQLAGAVTCGKNCIMKHFIAETFDSGRNWVNQWQITYQTSNQNNTTSALSTLMCDRQPEPCYRRAWVPATSRLLLSLSLHMMSRLASIMSEAECSVFETHARTHTSQPLIAWLSSDVRWWSTSQSGWNRLSRTALENFTSWSSSSHEDAVMLGKAPWTSICYRFFRHSEMLWYKLYFQFSCIYVFKRGDGRQQKTAGGWEASCPEGTASKEAALESH